METKTIQEDLKRLGTKETARRIREELKQIKGCKFSVSCEYFAGGSSITFALMNSNFKVIKDFEDISQDAISDYETRDYTKEQIKERQAGKYHQLNQHCFKDEYNEDLWSNGVFLTKEGHKLFQEVMKIIKKYHRDDSDSMIDYFDTNFYLDLHIGNHKKDYELKEEVN